jgi:hypothetical protein
VKKLSFEQKQYQLKRNKKKINKIVKYKKESQKKKRVLIDAPEVFCLVNQSDRENLLTFLKQIKTNVSDGRKVYLSFRETKTLVVCGTLFAVASIESIVKLYPKMISCSYPRDDIVEQLFQHIGFLKLLGKPDNRKTITAENVRYWHYIQGVSTDDVSKFKNLLESIKLNEEIQSGLFESMSEAVTNTIQHAYDNSKKTWWLFAQKKDRLFEIAICDLGIGIPASLNKKPELKEFIISSVHQIKKRRDTALIEVAVGTNRSSTKLAHRGKGLKDMLEFAKTNNIGGFRIFSAKGVFDYNSFNHQESRKDYHDEIRGTIVQWKIPLGDKNEQ